jgi:hypothetical protein
LQSGSHCPGKTIPSTAAYLVALPLTILLASTAFAQEIESAKPKQKHMVRFSFKAGAVRHTVMMQDMVMTMNIGAEDMVTKVKTTSWSTTTTKSVKGNIAEIEQKVTRVKAFADSITMKVDYDSNDEDSDPGVLEVLADLVGQKITMKLSDQGKISDVVMPDDADQLKAAGMDMEQLMSQTVTQLPDHPIAIGESWKVQQENSVGQFGKMDSETTYTLLHINKEFISLKHSMVCDTENVVMPGGATIDTMKVTGTSKIDLRTGMPIEMNFTMSTKVSGQMKMEMEMSMTLSIKPAPAQGKKVDDAAKPKGGKEAGK